MFLMVHDKFYDTPAAYAIGSIQKVTSAVRNYPLLQAENTKLLRENAMLRGELLKTEEVIGQPHATAPYHLIAARVINNSIVSTKNYLTLNKGAIDGVVPGMGVVSTAGIVGRVKAVSNRFATVTSLLHTAMQVSAKLSNSKVLGTVQWPGHDPLLAKMLYVPRHVPVAAGDTVVTSGYNTIFPAGVVIGHIKQAKLSAEAPFYDIELHISTEFSTLQYVYVVKNNWKREQEDLEQYTKAFYE